MLPRVILHLAVSADGGTSGFAADLGAYYGLVAHFQEDLTLAGSETILRAGFAEDSGEGAPAASPSEQDTRPLLAVVDSRGRVRTWKALRHSGYWRDVMALCSETTPPDYLASLDALDVEYLRLGEQRVDLRGALEALHSRYGVGVVRVESGGVLNGALLARGLVHEVSLLVHPVVVGGSAGSSIVGVDFSGPAQLELQSVETLERGLVWLRYRVPQAADS